MDAIRQHDVILRDGELVLRPMTEGDWDILQAWNTDPEVLYYTEGDDVQERSLEDTQGIYREVSQAAYCFIIEVDGRPIGECWLQQMNLDRILAQYPGADCRRIDMGIGEKDCWGRGYGTRMMRLLTHFAFVDEGADAVFGCDVADYNPRSRRTFERAGFGVHQERPQPEGRKARVCCDLILTRQAYLSNEKNQRED